MSVARCKVCRGLGLLILMATLVHSNSNGLSGLGELLTLFNLSANACGDGLLLCQGNKATYSGRFRYVPSLPADIYVVDIKGVLPSTLTSRFFANLTNVSALDLSDNNITWLPRDVFAGMDSLRHLVLDHNRHLELDSLREVLSVPTLMSVSLQYCNLKPPPTSLFQNITSNMQSIVLDHNPFVDVYPLDRFCALPSLRRLSLRYCSLTGVITSCPLTRLSRLQLAHNLLKEFPFTCASNKSGESLFPNLTNLILTQNDIRSLGSRSCLPSLRHLDMSYNRISAYPTSSFATSDLPLLTVLWLHDQRVTLSGDHPSPGMQSMGDHAFNNEHLQTLDLSNNGISFANHGISKQAFANCSGLRSLHLNSNNFTFVNHQRFQDLFGHLRSLVDLSMLHCKFESLTTRTFVSFHNLTTLTLTDNMISDLPDGAFDSLHKLDSLSLDHNKISEVNELTFSQHLLDNLSWLTLSFNPYHCSCDLLWFAHRYQTEESQLFKDAAFHSYTCENLAGMSLANFSLAEQACLLSHETNLLLIQFCSIFIVALTLVSLVFRYRWHIRLLMYEVFRGRDDLRRQRLRANHFDYDLFVSYASEDLPWVRQHLMPTLEDDMGLKLCIHERDFIPGCHIVDNIVRCVESSKKVLMVFSLPFVHSQWCQFELALCLTHVLDYDDALIVVCVDDVTTGQMTSAMRAVLKTMTYIQWREEEEDAVASFWGRLRLGLHEILPRGEHYV